MPDACDNCPLTYNPRECRPGADWRCAAYDTCADFPLSPDCWQPDADGDGVGDACEGPAICPGDTNCDRRVTFADIDPFVEALSGESAWNQHHPGCPWLNADCNGSGTVTFADIDPFVAVIGTTCH